jgi:hypothetical protein
MSHLQSLRLLPPPVHCHCRSRPRLCRRFNNRTHTDKHKRTYTHTHMHKHTSANSKCQCPHALLGEHGGAFVSECTGRQRSAPPTRGAKEGSVHQARITLPPSHTHVHTQGPRRGPFIRRASPTPFSHTCTHPGAKEGAIHRQGGVHSSGAHHPPPFSHTYVHTQPPSPSNTA